MPFTNPILAGEELIRSGIKSNDYAAALAGWRISRDGSAEYQSMSVRDTLSAASLLYSGTDVADAIDILPRGVVAWDQFYPNVNAPTTGIALRHLDAPLRPNRMYWVEIAGLTQDTGFELELALRYTLDGSLPNTGSNVATTSLRQSIFHLNTMSFGFHTTGPDVNVTQLRLLITAAGIGGTVHLTTFWDNGCYWSVKDAGRHIAGSGFAPAAAAKTWKEFDIQPYDSRSYTGSGANLPYGGQYCFQGDIGIDGNRRSWMWLDPNAGGSGSINNMAGVPLTDVDYCLLFLNYDHWYYSTGGTSVIGYHNSTSVTDTEQGGGAPNRMTAGWPGRDVGQWVDIKGCAAIMDAIRAGTFKGFVLGNTGSASLTQYGYAHGASAPLGLKPGFKARYLK